MQSWRRRLAWESRACLEEVRDTTKPDIVSAKEGSSTIKDVRCIVLEPAPEARHIQLVAQLPPCLVIFSEANSEYL